MFPPPSPVSLLDIPPTPGRLIPTFLNIPDILRRTKVPTDYSRNVRTQGYTRLETPPGNNLDPTGNRLKCHRNPLQKAHLHKDDEKVKSSILVTKSVKRA